VRAHQVLRSVSVTDQDGAKAQLVAGRSLSAVARRDERLEVRVLNAPKEVEGPLAAGTRVGTVQVLRRGAVVGTTGLVTARDVPKASIPQRIRAWLARSGTVLLLALLAGCTVVLVLLRRRIVRRRAAGKTDVQ
jgi:D-alanyl-D-alanine carboxypeptidase (penicillin-binding protein 5/6)